MGDETVQAEATSLLIDDAQIPANPFTPYQAVLERLGVNAHDLAQLTAEASILQDLLADLAILNDLHVSQYTLANWTRALTDLVDPDIEKDAANYSSFEWFKANVLRQSITTKRYHLNERLSSSLAQTLVSASGYSDSEMIAVWVGLALLTVLDVTVKSAIGQPLLTADIAYLLAVIWNFNDTVATTPSALQLALQGEHLLASISAVAATQMAGATIAATLYEYASIPELAAIGEHGAGALTGGSFAVATFACYFGEEIKIAKCNKHIVELSHRLCVVESVLKSNDFVKVNGQTAAGHRANTLRKQAVLTKILLIERAQRENYQRSAKAYLACAVVMTIVAVVAYVALSGLTFGALPAVTVLALIGAVVVGGLRAKWVSQVDHVANAKQVLAPPVANAATLASTAAVANVYAPLEIEAAPKLSLYERLHAIILSKPFGWNFKQEVTIKPYAVFYNSEITHSLECYLNELAFKNPVKLAAIVLALESKDVTPADFKQKLEINQTPRFDCVIGNTDTLGSRLFMAYEKLNTIAQSQANLTASAAAPAAPDSSLLFF